jgi:uncharacterized membrane protein
MTDTTPTEPMAKPRRRWLTPLLVASLAVNLLVLGSVAGWAWRHGPGGHWRGPNGGDERILWLLPEAKRDAAAQIIARYRQNDETRKADARAARQAVSTALLAEPFSRPVLEQALTALGALEVGQRLKPQMLGEIAGTLTLDERKELASHLERIMERRGRWRGKDS